MRLVLVIVFVVLAAVAQAGDNKWTSSGPYGAQIGAISFHPTINNLIFAGGGGSLFRSVNAGQTWQRLQLTGAGQFPGAFIVRVHPQNPSLILAASYSTFASTNQGATWQEISPTSRLDGDFIMDMEFDPASSQVLYGVTYRSGVLKSTDGGRTWQAKNTGLKIIPVVPCCDEPSIEVDPKNGKTVYALLASRLVYKTTDGGDHWTQLKNGLDLHDREAFFLTVDRKNPQTIYAGGSNSFKSTNGGAQWVKICDCGGRNLAIDPRNSQTLYLASGGFLKSTNGGATWTNFVLPTSSTGGLLDVEAHPKLNLVFVGGFGNGMARSQNGGATWQTVNSGLNAFFVEHIETHPQRPNTIFALSSPQLSRSTDTGKTWKLVTEINFLFIRSFQIHLENPNLIFAGGGGVPAVALSTDGGKTWAPKSPYTDTPYGAMSTKFDPKDQKTMYLLPIDGGPSSSSDDDIHYGIAKSTDTGNSWKLINSGISDKYLVSVSVDPRNGSNIFVGSQHGKVFKSVNAGSSWKNVSAGLNGQPIYTITVDPTNSSTVYLSTRQYSAGTTAAVFKSINGGSTWTLKNNGVPRPSWAFRSIVVDPENPRTIFLSTQAGLFVSTDAAESWSPYDSNGLGPFSVKDLFIHPVDKSTLFIGTDQGVFSYTRTGSPDGPIIDQISPAAGKPGDSVAINGRNFGSTQGNSTVTFSGVSAGTAQSWTDTRIQTKAPSGVSTGPVTVTVASRKSNAFEFIALPASGNLSPASGPSSGGTRVTILGPSGISGTQFNVLFGSAVASNIRFTAPNIITCTTPPGSGTVDVSVTSSAVVAKVGTFTYQ
jgi:photosystem II stability/assembly factor-like uncharacterized protein